MASRSQMKPGVLDALRRFLAPAVTPAGFVLADASPPGDGPEANVGMLEYFADAAEGRLLLGFYEDLAERTIVGELWSPERLRRAAPQFAVDAIGARSRTWRYEPDVDPDAFAREIGAEATAWLDAPASGR